VITRIEIDGFKSFVDFELDVSPFMVLLGPNAGGKSNLLDALRALVEIGDGGSFSSLYEAGRGTPREMFHQREDESRVSNARIRCEMVVDASEIGGQVGLAFQADASYATALSEDRLRIKAEVSGDPADIASLDSPDVAVAVQANLRRAGREITAGPEHRGVVVLPPGALSGLGFPFDKMADGSQRAMWFLARELHTWQFLSLVPSGMRERGLVTDAGPLRTDGSNLAAVLGRISRTDAKWDLVADAVALVPGLRDVNVERDRDYWELELSFRGTGRVSARMASDGTLRVLAILAALHDPEKSGVLLVDEVENGLHPARLTELLKRTRARVTDWRQSLPEGTRLRQVIFTTHSPVVLSSLYPEHRGDLVFLSAFSHPWQIEGQAVGSLVTRASTVGADEQRGASMALGEARRILETVHSAEVPACDT
jgi:predicted ATPase